MLALALVHHLTIGRNIRLAMVADLFARLAPNLIVEFIPESDPMVQRLIGTRDDVLPLPLDRGLPGGLRRTLQYP